MHDDRVHRPLAQRQRAAFRAHEREARVAAAGEREHGKGRVDADHRAVDCIAEVLRGVARAATEIDDEAGAFRKLPRHLRAMALPYRVAGDQLVR